MGTIKKSRTFKLIALDLDGTLLNRRHEISDENRKAIAEAVEKGVQVVISTGRHVKSCRDYAGSMQLSSYLVAVNGGEIWDPSGNLIERNPLQQDFVQTMWELSQQHGTRFWAMTPDLELRDGFPEEIAEREWLKFGFDVDDHEIRETILTELRKNKQLEISNSSPHNIEVNALGINKANALKKVCDRIGITMDQVLAVGDSLNDLAMIQEAGCGVAMGNAQDLVKEAADWVTDTNEADGVAKAIRYWVLDEEKA
ncbi:Cof-type HAD-IIB family hydrolase [Lederbergia sp. NSJ-179]|uniref:Cof-type HAD-IIB family hydrolase n=1 Tax=Lederbergia sp. NSJ-179 TaxID=2931402 RepID=UPI001FD4BA6A|nr:Cof-type HAD-IIB family hydrolase [Lederbergia sp. NSJ-179]MCJ7843122.1 Cof-type HAD-IIB family hydrolase [Lederbergia sp. NSJ-179]